jgi:Family of unknown function (DUF6932)
MSLPAFNEFGDLPEGVYSQSLTEVVNRFGSGSRQREEVTRRLRRVWDLALQSGGLDRLIVYGSYVTSKSEPNDVDVLLVMKDDFQLAACPELPRVLFDHAKADSELGASVFWIRPGMLLNETLDQFIAGWQLTRDHRRRGIVEIKP